MRNSSDAMPRGYFIVLALALLVSATSVIGVSSANAAAGTITSGGCSATVGEVNTATISQVGSDCVIRFTSGSNTWTLPAGVTSVRYLVVAGGGAGGAAGGTDGSGGGGAGGVLSGTFTPGASSYSVTVGNGGASSSASAGSHNPASFNGTNSTLSGVALTTISAIGGGSASSESGITRFAQDGGSGGGAGGYSGTKGSGTAGPPRQGYDGGSATGPGDGGGGGAGAPGGNGNSANGGTPAREGGVGVTNDITGTITYYGGGGGASGDPRSGLSAGGAGGLGGGGTGATASANSAAAGSGTANTGGGGGGAAGNSPVGSVKPTGAGGSGVVIIRYQGDVTAPTITGPSSATGTTSAKSIPENSTAVHTFTANESVTWSRSGTDASFFSITSGGVLTITSRNFEAPADSGLNNTYIVTITATDLGSNVKTQELTVTITNVNEAPTITNNSSAATNTISQAENITSVVTYAATDVDAGTTLTFSITGGIDAADFTINSSTGVLSFAANPNFEAPTDSNVNNIYVVEITVSDGSLTDFQTLTITVTNVNEAPTFTNNSSSPTYALSHAENNSSVLTYAATDVDAGATLTFSITGGADAADFTINSSTGVLAFTVNPNFEAPADSNVNNIYVVEITVSDGSLTDVQTLTITVTNVNEAPTITNNSSSATYARSQAENGTSVITYAATDVDAGTTLTFSITGGADAEDFTINSSTGVLAFISTPDFEAPSDSDQNNIYIVEITVSDGPLTDVQTLTLTITNANEIAVLGVPVVSGNIYKGKRINITVISTVAGKVRFYLGSKRISGCLSKTTPGTYPSYTATCSWKPPVTGKQILTARITPTDNSFSAAISERSEVWVLRRTGTR